MSSRHPRANRECRIGDQLLAYEFQRAARRTIGLSVGPQGLSVRAPHWTPLAEVDALLLRKADWVLAKLRQLEQASRLAPVPTEWRQGPSCPAWGAAWCWNSTPSPVLIPIPGCIPRGWPRSWPAGACGCRWRATPAPIRFAPWPRPG